MNPDICNGKPVVRGMRITVKTILDFLAGGETFDQLLQSYPYLEREDIYACLRFASLLVDKDKTFLRIPA
jgi:uncharacterized protein (DUF433 family)